MRISNARLGVVVLGLLMATPVLANTVPIPANPPASKCVTAATTASHDAYQSRLEKDVAPYAKSMPAVVKAYRDALDTAWWAMQQPYCGSGQYGVAPFIHSYQKSVDRERATFLAAVKGKVVAAVSTTPAPQPLTIPKKNVKLSIPTGLQRGMHSEDVKMLQAFLAAHFKLAYDDLATGYFGPLTEKYLIKYQIETKIVAKATTPGAGLFGPKTARIINGK
jgi:hypothetical protein